MNAELRSTFDTELEAVLSELPARIHQLMDEIPLVVEDYPSPEVMRKVRVRHRRQLCGLYTGIPLNNRSVSDWGVPSDVIHIYREGIFRSPRAAMAASACLACESRSALRSCTNTATIMG